MQITSQHRLETLFRRTSYAKSFRYIQSFTTKQNRFQDNFCTLDHILFSHTYCEWFSYIRVFNNEHITLFYLPIFPPQATPTISELLYPDILCIINLNAISASYDVKYIKELPGQQLLLLSKIFCHFGTTFKITIASSNQQSNANSRFQNHQVAHTVTPPNNPLPTHP